MMTNESSSCQISSSDTNITQGLRANPFAWSGETNNILINGYGISAGGNTPGPSCSLPVIDVKPNTQYRFRLIEGTALSLVSLAFGHPDLTVIEADGQYTKPYNSLSSDRQWSTI